MSVSALWKFMESLLNGQKMFISLGRRKQKNEKYMVHSFLLGFSTRKITQSNRPGNIDMLCYDSAASSNWYFVLHIMYTLVKVLPDMRDYLKCPQV